jgi:hypothetical protein
LTHGQDNYVDLLMSILTLLYALPLQNGPQNRRLEECLKNRRFIDTTYDASAWVMGKRISGEKEKRLNGRRTIKALIA